MGYYRECKEKRAKAQNKKENKMLFEYNFDELKSAKTAEDFYDACCGIGFQWDIEGLYFPDFDYTVLVDEYDIADFLGVDPDASKEIRRAYMAYEEKCDAHFLWKERRAIKKAAKSCVEEY